MDRACKSYSTLRRIIIKLLLLFVLFFVLLRVEKRSGGTKRDESNGRNVLKRKMQEK